VENRLAIANEIAERRYECSFEAIERWDGAYSVHARGCRQYGRQHAPHVVRTDAKAPAKPACRFMGTLSRSTRCGFIRQCGKNSRILGL
jgi:hypothetical protein